MAGLRLGSYAEGAPARQAGRQAAAASGEFTLLLVHMWLPQLLSLSSRQSFVFAGAVSASLEARFRKAVVMPQSVASIEFTVYNDPAARHDIHQLLAASTMSSAEYAEPLYGTLKVRGQGGEGERGGGGCDGASQAAQRRRYTKHEGVA